MANGLLVDSTSAAKVSIIYREAKILRSPRRARSARPAIQGRRIAFSAAFPLTIRAYMLICRREGKRHKGRRGRDQNWIRRNSGWRMAPDRHGGGCHDGGIPQPVFNHSILYQLSMLCDSIASCVPFSAALAIFEESQPKGLSMNYLRVKRCFPNQAESSLIKLFFDPQHPSIQWGNTLSIQSWFRNSHSTSGPNSGKWSSQELHELALS
jgi:hypothetical protein